MGEKFCKNQTKCKDKPRKIYACMAHLNEALVYECPYSQRDVHYDPKTKQFYVQKNLPRGRECEDFEITEKAKKDLADEVNHLENIQKNSRPYVQINPLPVPLKRN